MKIEIKHDKKYHLGGLYIIHNPYSSGPNKLYMLVQTTPNECCLIDLEVGNRFVDPIKVHSTRKITESEFSSMVSNNSVTYMGRIAVE